MKSIKQFDIWLANLNPQKGTEPGKIRPVVIVQSDLLNEYSDSTVICPFTSNVKPEIKLLRVHVKSGQLDQACDILVDQLRAIDNKRLIEKIGHLTNPQIKKLKENIKIVLDLE